MPAAFLGPALVVYAILAGVVAPLSAMNSNIRAARFLVADEIVVSVGAIQALLAVAAVCCALGAAPRLSRHRVVLGVLLIIGWGGALAAAGTQAGGQAWTLMTVVGAGLPLVALFALAAPTGLCTSSMTWLCGGLAVAVGYPMCVYLALLSGLGHVGIVISGGEVSVDGVPAVLPGIMVGVVAGMAARSLAGQESAPGPLALPSEVGAT